MASTYIQLVNRLRDRFNEPRFNATTWALAVGFDQFTKDAVNYAYHDILNAEMEWPFLHQTMTFNTTPGDQFYIPTISPTTGLNDAIKEIDWESFYINTNAVLASTSAHYTVPSVFPYEVTLTINDDPPFTPNVSVPSWSTDGGVTYVSGGTGALTPTQSDPTDGEYTITPLGNYRFSADDAASVVNIIYTEAAATVIANPINPQFLPYIDFDYWRQTYLNRDLSAAPSSRQIPQNVFKTQNLGEVGITPVPDKIYEISFEYWLDANDMSATTSTCLLPTRFEQIILDGASKYCYEFREDQPMATMADARFKAGIARMRIELINRSISMQSGFYWYPHGRSYTMNTG